jgi:glycosyltransferase involved in cell wall biosynthesis
MTTAVAVDMGARYMVFENLIGKGKEADTALAVADEARDAKEWRKAAKAYRQVLALAPERADIFVQYGHALKESGDLDAAEAAYRRAIALNAQVADFHLQLGHALKLLGRRDEAGDSYRRANELAPDLAAAALELRTLDPDFVLASQVERGQCLVIDLSDLFFYLRHHPTPSGIQRVQIGLALALLSPKNGDKRKRDLKFIVDGGDLGAYVALRIEAIPRLFAELSRKQVSHVRLLQLMSEEVGLGSLFMVTRGDVVVVLGAFWVIANAIERYSAVKRAGGRLVVLIHDIIPITHPEYCEASLTDVFRAFCAHVLQITDLVLTVSDHSGRQVAEYLAARCTPIIPPIRTLRSAHNTLPTATVPSAAISGASKISRLVSTRFVLYVSTIEIRKNHTLLFRIWKQLIAKHGAARIPRLIFVGRPGWRVRDLMDQLESTRLLDGAIVILHGLSDIELSTLYQHALFTAFPSFEEGWGLPVGEGLTHGRPCLASNTSSIPEVVGDFALYADPFNFSESFTLYERMIFDAEAREALARRIKTSFQPRTWVDVARDLMGLINQNVKAFNVGEALVPIPKIAPGRLTHVGHRGDMSAFVRRGIGEIVYFLFDDGWGAVENFGRWITRRIASFEFAVDASVSVEALLILTINSPEWLSDATTLTITVNGRRFVTTRPLKGQLSRLALRCPVVESRILTRFEIDGEIVMGNDPRQLSYGLRSFGYAGLDDVAARLDLLEQITFESARVETLEPENDLYGS